MPTPVLLLLIATLLPLVSFALLVFIGKRMGNPLAGWVGTGAIGISFVLSLVALMSWVSAGNPQSGTEWGMGKAPINLPHYWVPVGAFTGQQHLGWLDVGLFVDSLTIAMFGMITLVATLVHVFSLGYMAEDKRFPRFFTYLSLFCFSMLGLVIGGTILQLFIFWELVGLCSYLLIGFWYEKKSASNAAIKAFVTNRVGDFGFLIGFGILFYHLGNATLPNVWAALDASKLTAAGITVNGTLFTTGLLTVMGIGLFFGAVGKSAQFPLHVWLPDAMEGPTPVSALIHAATMVAAGVYLVARIFPILTPDAKLFIAIIGCVTLTMAALIAIAQSDIKKVLAYSTLSQLGYMILALGIGSWVGGLFHLITHAFFKALLFLGSGSVIHAAHHEQELPQYGGLIRKIPITGVTFGIAVLAIAGTPFLSAYFSKDMILAHAAAFADSATHGGHGSKFYWLLFILPTAIAYVTAFYMMRCWMLTFWGKPRNQHLYDHAHESALLWGPLAVLAFFSIFAGYEFMNIKGLITSSIIENNNHVRNVMAIHDFKGFDLAWPANDPEHDPAFAGKTLTQSQNIHVHGWHLTHTWVMAAPFLGMGLAFLIYLRGYWITDPLMRFWPIRMIHTWLYRRMYFDELYFLCLVAPIKGLARVGAWFDRMVIDGIVNSAAGGIRTLSYIAGLHDKYIVDGAVNGVASATQSLGSAVKNPESGRVRLYVTLLLGTLVLGLTAAIVIAISLAP